MGTTTTARPPSTTPNSVNGRKPAVSVRTAPNGHPRPGRVRSTFRLADEIEAKPEAEVPSARRLSAPMSLAAASDLPTPLLRSVAAFAAVDWAEVARLRGEASSALTEAIGEQPSMDRPAQELLGRSIIDRLLDAADASSVAQRAEARTLPERQRLADAVFDALFRLGRLQPLLDDPEVENVMITGYDRVVVERADGTLVEADPVADSD